MKETLTDANFPRNSEGGTYHVGTKSGEVANRIITVGDYTRARRISKSFDGGTFSGVPITVIAIGMGFSLVDFFVRECRAVVQGEMIIVRLGSCGSLSNSAPIGTLVVPFTSFGVTRNYDHFFKEDQSQERTAPYNITRALPCDKEVHDALLNSLQKTMPQDQSGTLSMKVIGNVVNASADSFYSSQEMKKLHPNVQTLEMETFLLNHLALSANASQSCKEGKSGQIRTGAAQMVFANRETRQFVTPSQVEALEEWCGKAVCQALIDVHIPSERLHGDGVWSAK